MREQVEVLEWIAEGRPDDVMTGGHPQGDSEGA